MKRVGVVLAALLATTIAIGGSGQAPENVAIEAISASDMKAAFLLERPVKETTFYLYDTITGSRMQVGTAHYDPVNKTWVIELYGLRIGIMDEYRGRNADTKS